MDISKDLPIKREIEMNAQETYYTSEVFNGREPGS